MSPISSARLCLSRPEISLTPTLPETRARQPVARARAALRRARLSLAANLSPASVLAPPTDPTEAIATHPWRCPQKRTTARQALAGALSTGAGALTAVGAYVSALSPQAGGPMIAVAMGVWMAASLASPQAAGGRLGKVAAGLKTSAACLGALGGLGLACPGPTGLAGLALLGTAALLAVASLACLTVAHRDGGWRHALPWALADLTGLPGLHRRERAPASLPGS